MYEEDTPESPVSNIVDWGLIDVKTDGQLFKEELSGEADWAEVTGPLLCTRCNLEFVSDSQFFCHHLQHVSSPFVVIPQLTCRQQRRLLAGKRVKKRAGPRSRTEGIVPPSAPSPIKLIIKRLSTCREPAFEVVLKKKDKTLSAMDEMIPGGVEENQIPSFPQCPSPSPSDILRQEVNADTHRSSWESLAYSFGFLAPELPLEAAQEAEPTVNGDKHPSPEPHDKEGELPVDPEAPQLPPPSELPPAENGHTDGEPEESPDSGCEKDSSEKDFGCFDSNSDKTSPPPPSNPSPIGCLTIRAPSDLNSSVVSGSSSESLNAASEGTPLPLSPVISTPPGLIIKTPAALGAPLAGSVNLLNTESLLRPYVEPDFIQTCEVCGDKSGNLEQHKAQLGHYKCLITPECTTVFTTAVEFSSHQHVAHGIAPPPNHQSLAQLQQQVQRIQVPFGVPAGITLSYPSAPGSAQASPSSTPTPPLTGGIQARPFALATSPSTIRPDGSPVASPALPAGLGRSISISPSVKPGQKRTTPPTPVVESAKRSRADSPDCELVDVQQPLPALPSGISLTVRGSGNKESSGVANILASRGITVTPAANKSPAPAPPRANNSPQPITSLNLGSAVSIVPASQSRTQFAVPQGRSVSRPAAASTTRTPTVDLTQDNDRPVFRRNRPQRFTCQVCDKVFTSQETLNTHLTTHRSPGKLPHKCNLCNALYPTQQALLQHKQTYHKEAQGSEMALPVVDMKVPGVVQKLSQLGIRHCLILSQLGNASGGVFGLPIISMDNARNPAISNLAALGASNVLSMGPAKALR